MCVVLLIIALLIGVTAPAMHSAFIEQDIRNDSHQLALMIRTAMLKSDEQRRSFVIELDGSNVALHAFVPPSVAVDSTAAAAPADEPALPDFDADFTLDASNKLLLPDPEKAGEWLPVKSTSWVFQPGNLCRVPKVRLMRGKAWMELSFNALTGDVEDETTYFP